jgi:hypothetical protein
MQLILFFLTIYDVIFICDCSAMVSLPPEICEGMYKFLLL